MSFQFVRVCDILLYGLNDIFAYVGSIHKTYLLIAIEFFTKESTREQMDVIVLDM